MTIPRLDLDPRNDRELLEQSQLRVTNASGGQLSDFAPAGPLAALLEGQVYLTGALLWWLNQLPLATSLEVMRLSGVERSLGTKAQGRLEFTLDAVRSRDYFLPAGFRVEFSGLIYRLTEALVIAAGGLSGTVAVEAAEVGSGYNLRPYQFESRTGLAGVATVTNPARLAGGSDPEPLEQTLERAQQAIRARGVVVTLQDYEAAAREYLGFGSSAVAFARLGGDRDTEVPGAVHVVCTTAEGEPVSEAVAAALKAELASRSPGGSYTYVSGPVLVPIGLSLVVNLDQIRADLSADMWAYLRQELKAGVYALGRDLVLADVEYLVRKNYPGVRVSSIGAGQERVEVALDRFSYPDLETLTLTQIDGKGQSLTEIQGKGIGDPD